MLDLRIGDGVLQAITPASSWSMPVRGNVVRLVLDGPVGELFNEAGTMALPLPSATGLTIAATGSGQAMAYRLEARELPAS